MDICHIYTLEVSSNISHGRIKEATDTNLLEVAGSSETAHTLATWNHLDSIRLWLWLPRQTSTTSATIQLTTTLINPHQDAILYVRVKVHVAGGWRHVNDEMTEFASWLWVVMLKLKMREDESKRS